MNKTRFYIISLFIFFLLGNAFDVLAQPKAVFSASATRGCEPFLVEFTDYSTGNPTSWFWDFGNGQTSKDHNPIAYYKYPGLYTVSLFVKNNDGIDSSIKTDYIEVIARPVTHFSLTSATGCLPLVVFFKDSSIANDNGIIKWNWDFGDSTTSTRDTVYHTYYTPGTFSVTLVTTNTSGCSDTLVLKDTVRTANRPLTAFTATPLVACASTPISFVNRTIGNVSSWYWEFGDGDTSSRRAPQHLYNDTGYMNVKLKVTYGVCVDSLELRHYIYIKPPIVKMKYSYNCALPYDRTFQAKYIGEKSFYWDFHDGTTSTSKSPKHTFPAPGKYIVTIYANTNECDYSDSLVIDIIDENSSFKVNSMRDPICRNDSVEFEATNINSSLFSGFAWNFGDGTSAGFSDEKTSIHAYKNNGSFTPALITKDILGCIDTVYIDKNIDIYGPSANFSVIPYACINYTTTFTDKSIPDSISSIKKWIWDYGDGTVDTLTTPPFDHIYQTSDTFSVNLKVIDTDGCQDTTTKVSAIIGIEKPVAYFSITDTTACLLTPVYFVDSSQGSALGIKWFYGDGTNSSEDTNPQHTYNQTGTYRISIIVGGGTPCADTAFKTINVFPLPQVDAGNNSTICLGQSLMLKSAGAVSYVWAADASLSCTECVSPEATPQTNTTYHLTGTDAVGCSASDSVIIEVKEPFELALKNTDTLCAGSSLQLLASGAEIYNWQPSNGLSAINIPDPIASPPVTTTYTVTGSDSLNCFTNTASTLITVAPHPQFNIVDSVANLSAGAAYIIKTTNSPDVVKWQWLPPTYLSCIECPEPVAKASGNINYTGIAYNAFGCSDTDRIIIKGSCSKDMIFIPSAFSPDGDGHNDFFYPRGQGIYLIKSMRVFNRLGQVVFEKVNLTPNIERQGWDGVFRSKRLQTDVYMYFIEVICNDGQVISLKGNVSLL